MAENLENPVECAIAIVWPEGAREPVCEMFRVDRRAMRWTSKHYSSGTTFSDGGRLHDGETARSLAASGTRSGLHRFSHLTTVTFVVADLEPAQFESTRPTDWTVGQLTRLPGADVSTHEPL
ncbi:MAG: hypothetical protein Q8L48_30395 [Archangium sp.]|nr:hypothetical protein [Archangium sp.]